VDLSAYADLAVTLANSAADGKEETGNSEDRDNISTLDGLRALLTKVDFPGSRTSRSDLEAMRGLRAEFREIFAACAAGDAAGAVDRLNALLIQHPVHPQITSHDGQPWHLHLTDGGSVADRYAAASAMGLAILLTRLGPERLGVCQGQSCGAVFVDSSPGHSRRYCSVRCSSRVKVTSLRTRKRTDGTASLPTAAV
jgi:predicted RNA-binding Zn ribbon-like protein